MTARDVAVWLLGGAGAALLVLAVAGVTLLPDELDRLHLTSPASLGVVLLCAAVAVREPASQIGDKAIILGAFALLSAPVLTHVTGRTVHLARRREREER